MLRHIAWFNEALIEPHPEGGLTSDDGDVRRRCLVPARALEKLGIECSIFGNLLDADPAHVGQHLEKLGTDIVVIGKISSHSLVKLANTAKHLGCYIVADFDDTATLSHPVIALIEIADQLVASTASTAEAIQKQTGLRVLVIPDGDDEHSLNTIAHLWRDGFKQLKLKPPACANMNVPEGG